MIFNRKAMQSMVVMCMLCMLSITAVTGNGYADGSCYGPGDEAANDKLVAGAAEKFAEFAWELDQELDLAVTVEKTDVDLAGNTVDADNEDIGETGSILIPVPEPMNKTAEELEWEDRLMTNVKDYLKVREGPGTDYKVVGKLFKGDLATVEEPGEEWTKISSGNVVGYVNNEYCATGLGALEIAKKNCVMVATSTTRGLRVRREANTDSRIITRINTGEELPVATKAEVVDGWIPVTYALKTCYVSEEFAIVSFKTGTALTLEEEADAIAAEKKRKEEELAKRLKATGSLKAAQADDVTLLAAIIQCEAGAESYECQLGVGAVVMNRVHSRKYPNTVYEVIYQSGQFSPAASGRLEQRLKSGVSKSALKAAEEAMSGVDNTDGAIGFWLASTGRKGKVIGPIVYFK